MTKEFDTCSVLLFSKNVQGAALPSIWIYGYAVVRKGQLAQPSLELKMSIELEDAYIRSYQISTLERLESGPVLAESVTIAFNRITLRHHNPGNSAGFQLAP